jgi:transcription-repair coupling factor (superfamily II helicase)
VSSRHRALADPPVEHLLSHPPTSVDDLIDPGLAVGPVAAVLRRARRAFEDELDADELVVGPSLRPLVLALLAERTTPLLVLTPRTSDAQGLTEGLAAFLGPERVALFPAWETLPSERLSPQAATVGRRMAVLDRLVHPEAHAEPLVAVVAPVRAALQPMDPSLATRRPLTVDGSTDGFDTLVARLAALGYGRRAQVEARGEFAVRGGIVDVFPTAADHAVRIEFFGDDVESLREFSVGDQRSVGPVESVTIDPAREVVVDERLRAAAADAIGRWPHLADDLDRLAEGQTF